MSNYVPAKGTQDPLWKGGGLEVSGSGVLRVSGSGTNGEDIHQDFKDHLGITSVETRLSLAEDEEAADMVSLDTRISTLDSEQDADQASLDLRVSNEEDNRVAADGSLTTRLSSEESKLVAEMASNDLAHGSLETKISVDVSAANASVDLRVSSQHIATRRPFKTTRHSYDVLSQFFTNRFLELI